MTIYVEVLAISMAPCVSITVVTIAMAPSIAISVVTIASSSTGIGRRSSSALALAEYVDRSIANYTLTDFIQSLVACTSHDWSSFFFVIVVLEELNLAVVIEITVAIIGISENFFTS